MSSRLVAVAASIAVALAACQGSFDAPEFDNPRDPANGQLPLTPEVDAAPCLGLGCNSSSCGPAACPPEIIVTWTIDGDGSGLGGFQIYRAATRDEDPGTVIGSVGESERCLVDGNLPGVPGPTAGATYWYRVRALSNTGVPSLRSAPDSVVAPACT